MSEEYDSQNQGADALALTPRERARLNMDLWQLQMDPKDESALIRGEYVPERLAQFQRRSGSEQARLQSQLEAAQQMAAAPTEVPKSASAGVVVPTVLANVLRTFGGALLANKKEQELGTQQAQSDQQFNDLMKMYEDAAGAGLNAKRRGLSHALRAYGGGEQPWTT